MVGLLGMNEWMKRNEQRFIWILSFSLHFIGRRAEFCPDQENLLQHNIGAAESCCWARCNYSAAFLKKDETHDYLRNIFILK